MQVGELLGPWVLRREIGEGGIAAVFIAEHASNKTEVVIKALRPAFLTQPDTVALFLAEPRALQRVEHENALEVIDVVAEGPERYFATELLRGRSLMEILRRGRLALPRAMHLARQVATVLAQAHDVDVVHRNLKPANVFVVQPGDGPELVKLLELGATRMQSQGDKPVPGTVIGTPAYMAPEQLRQVAGDHRVDMYSFGVLLFELAVGRRPFTGEVADLIRQHLLDPAPRARTLAPDVPEVLETLIAQCLDKDPEARPPSMNEVSLALGALAEKLGPPVVTDTGPTAWIAVPKNTSGYTTVVSDAVAAPPAVVAFEDDEPSFESITGETAAAKDDAAAKEHTAAKEDTAASDEAAARDDTDVTEEAEIDPALRGRPPRPTGRGPILAAAAVGALVTLAVVVFLAKALTSTPPPPDTEPEKPVPTDVEPKNVEPKKLEPTNVQPKIVEPKNVEPKDPEPKADVLDRYPVAFGSTPRGAQVWIRMDKRIRLLCTTPCTFDLPTGKEVHVELKLDGYKSAQRTLTVAEGARFNGTLQRK